LEASQDQLATDITKSRQALVTSRQALNQATANVGYADAALTAAQASAAVTVQQAQGVLDEAQGQLAQAQANYVVTAAPPTAAALAQAQAQVDAAIAALALAQSNLADAVLLAPADATIAQVNISVGQLISTNNQNAGAAASSGAPADSQQQAVNRTQQLLGVGAIVLSDLRALQVQAQVNEGDIGGVRPGNHVDFTVSAYPGAAFTGTVRSITPLGNSTSDIVTYTALVDIDPAPNPLLPTMTANTTITTASREGVLTLPAAAIQLAQDQRTRVAKRSGPAPDPNAGGNPANVLLLDRGEPVLQPIRVGLSDGTTTEVIAGLDEGQNVITSVSGS
jgi:HlyD family secretion protein